MDTCTASKVCCLKFSLYFSEDILIFIYLKAQRYALVFEVFSFNWQQIPRALSWYCFVPWGPISPCLTVVNPREAEGQVSHEYLQSFFKNTGFQIKYRTGCSNFISKQTLKVIETKSQRATFTSMITPGEFTVPKR